MPTLLDKIWAQHLVAEPEDGEPLIYCDRHLVHEVTSPQAFEGLRLAGRKLRRPDLTLAVEDHVTPTDLWRKRPLVDEMAEAQLTALETNCAEFGVKLFGMDNPRQGVIHVTMPEAGFILPGQTVFCGDSHTTTHGAMGALAFGVGTSQVEHIMATQCLRQAKPKAMAVKIKGELPKGVTAKDLILAIIAQVGFGGGAGHVLEYMGPAISALNMDQRMTVANMAVECGARGGIIAPDETTFAFLKGRPLAPSGADWDKAVAEWKELKSDPDAEFDRVLEIDASELEPRLTWGTNPAQSAGITQKVPDPASLDGDAEAAKKALDYMGLIPGQALAGLPVDVVFIGSCTNGRISDLRQAAEMVRGRRRAPGVRALVVPGSGEVKAQAEAEGLDQIFLRAGFEWREAGCSMCLAMNPDIARAGERCASTSNRNFEGRQGHGARTHLVSPAMAAASALTGRLTDPRELEG